MRALGNLGDPENRPFAAWIDVEDGRTFGMDVFGLPDVSAPSRDAALAACATMIRENRAPGD